MQPLAFFDALWNRVIGTELGTIFVAEIGRRGVAATILGGRDTLKHELGASEARSGPGGRSRVLPPVLGVTRVIPIDARTRSASR